MNKVPVATFSELADREPVHALVANVDLVVTRYDESVSVLYGRCAHRGALMSDGYVDGDNLWAGIYNTHFWVDPNRRIAVVVMMQLLPFYDEQCIDLLRGFEQRLYSGLRG